MSSAGPWSVKGIDPKAREIAKDLARRSGMTLGEWLNQMIIDGGEPDAPPMQDTAYHAAPDAFRRQAPPMGSRQPQFRGDYFDDGDPGELGRITRALEALSTRIEASEHRSTLAISGIDQSVMGVLARIDGVERDQNATAAGVHSQFEDVRSTQSKLADRLRRMETEDGSRVEAMKALEGALSRVAAQIYEGESRARAGLSEVRQDLSGMARRVDQLDAKLDSKADAGSTDLVDSVVSRIAERLEAAESRTAEAVRAMEASFAGLDERLKATETRLDPEAQADSPERRFERLAAELSEKVEASRTEMASRIREAADGKLDRMEAALRDLAVHVEKAERQSAQAIDRMGREVMRVAQTLGQRVETVEARSGALVEQVGGEMTRIADAMENRMRGADAVQAEALEKLGGEIARIAERLAERIASSERRSAQAIEDVGDQVARVTDKINQRNDQAAGELGERIRQSEERTAKLLQEAQEKLDRRLLDTQRRSAVEAAVQAVEGPGAVMGGFEAPYAPAFEAPPAEAAYSDDPFAAPPGQNNGFDEPVAGFAAESAPATAAPDFQSEFTRPAAPADGFDADFDAPSYAPAAYGLPPSDDFGDFDQPAPSARSSTRELIEQARAAARQASPAESRGRRGRAAAEGLSPLPGAPAPPLDADEAPRRFAGLRLGRRKKESSTIRTALLASGTAAALATTAVAAYMLYSEEAAPSRQLATAPPADALPITDDSTAAEILAPALSPETETATTAPASVAPAPTPSATTAASTPVATEPAPPSAQQLYSGAVRQIESGDATGLDPLRRAANLGYAPAQFYLAKLHETGSSGVAKDAGEARRWTERAAAGGDAKAMHNLGLYYFEGTGGAKNTINAATWFRRAAEAGLQDSQYNLARLYEQGYGVAQNGAEAYKWYLIAASGGDAEAKSSAERLRAQLSPDTQAAAQRSAAAFRAQAVRTASR
jgi:localization factor PodJL